MLVSDIAIFVLKEDVKLELTNSRIKDQTAPRQTSVSSN